MKNRVLAGGISAIFALFVANISTVSFAESSTDFSITVPDATIEISVPPTASITLDPIDSSGDFGNVTIDIEINTNNQTGYTLTMSPDNGEEDKTSLISATGVKLETLPASATGYSQMDFTPNKWGYKLAGDNYFPVPTTLNLESWVTDSPSASSVKSVTFAAKVDGLQNADTYMTTLVFQAVSNYVPITCDGPKCPSDRNDINDDSIHYVKDPETGEISRYVYPGNSLARAYEIAYSNAHKGMYEETTPGSGIYQYVDSWNGQNYQGGGRDVRFAIQDISMAIGNQTVCEATGLLDDHLPVLDLRDGKTYTIIKARDYRCWLGDNLALDPTIPAVKAKMLSETLTNATNVELNHLFNGGGTASDRYAMTGLVAWPYGKATPAEPYIYTNDAENVKSYDTMSINNGGWKNGVYYNYCAASVGTYCYGNGYEHSDGDYDYGSPINISGTAVDAEFDLCPAGWRLPTGGPITTPDGGEWQNLYNSYSNYADYRTAIRLPKSDGYGFGKYYVTTEYGYYWSSTYQASEGPSLMAVYENYINASEQGYRNDGLSVRCIAK